MATSRNLMLSTALVLAFGGSAFAQATSTEPVAPPPVTAPDATTPPATMPETAPTLAPDTAAPTPDPAAPMTTQAPAVATIDCEAEFDRLDVNGDGFLSESEAPDVHARARINAVTLQETGFPRAEYLTACNDNVFVRPIAEEGAPFEGANSFTEAQAQDRAVAYGVLGISALTKDDAGIWRGTGNFEGADVNVAVDYKGNVVTSAQ